MAKRVSTCDNAGKTTTAIITIQRILIFRMSLIFDSLSILILILQQLVMKKIFFFHFSPSKNLWAKII
jgi:hypothetical protein